MANNIEIQLNKKRNTTLGWELQLNNKCFLEITSTKAGSVARIQGLKKGNIILQVEVWNKQDNKWDTVQQMNDPSHVRKEVKKAETVKLTICSSVNELGNIEMDTEEVATVEEVAHDETGRLSTGSGTSRHSTGSVVGDSGILDQPGPSETDSGTSSRLSGGSEASGGRNISDRMRVSEYMEKKKRKSEEHREVDRQCQRKSYDGKEKRNTDERDGEDKETSESIEDAMVPVIELSKELRKVALDETGRLSTGSGTSRHSTGSVVGDSGILDQPGPSETDVSQTAMSTEHKEKIEKLSTRSSSRYDIIQHFEKEKAKKSKKAEWNRRRISAEKSEERENENFEGKEGEDETEQDEADALKAAVIAYLTKVFGDAGNKTSEKRAQSREELQKRIRLRHVIQTKKRQKPTEQQAAYFKGVTKAISAREAAAIVTKAMRARAVSGGMRKEIAELTQLARQGRLVDADLDSLADTLIGHAGDVPKPKVRVQKKKAKEHQNEFWNSVAERMFLQVLPEDRKWLRAQSQNPKSWLCRKYNQEILGKLDDASIMKDFIRSRLAEAKVLKEQVVRKHFLHLWRGFEEDVTQISNSIAEERKEARKEKRAPNDELIIKTHLAKTWGHVPEKEKEAVDDLLEDQLLQTSPTFARMDNSMDSKLLASLNESRQVKFISDRSIDLQQSLDDNSRGQVPFTPQSSRRPCGHQKTPQSAGGASCTRQVRRRICLDDLEEENLDDSATDPSPIKARKLHLGEIDVEEEPIAFEKGDIPFTSTPYPCSKDSRKRLHQDLEESIDGEQEAESKERKKLIPCDETCHLPENWALRLYRKFAVVTGQFKDAFEKQVAFVEMETCDGCALFQYPYCHFEDKCEDLLKLLRIIAVHSPELRTLLRRYYRARQLNSWMMQLDSIFESGSLVSLLKHIDTSTERSLELSFERTALPTWMRKSLEETKELYICRDATEVGNVQRVKGTIQKLRDAKF